MLSNWVLEKTPESPFDTKEIKPVIFKGDQHWIFTRRTDAEAEAPIFWSSDAKSWLPGKVHDAGKDWGQKEKRASEDEVAGCHHRYTMDMKLGKFWKMVRDREAWQAAVHGVAKSWAWLGDWTAATILFLAKVIKAFMSFKLYLDVNDVWLSSLLHQKEQDLFEYYKI